ncbi:MAG: hypothetical protein ACPL1K_03270, partial [Candidatus Kryptoniota bacterium]
MALFVDSNYSGQCVVKNVGEYPDPGSIGLPNDSISSIKVGTNVKATLCEHDNFRGVCETFTGDDPDLSNNSIGNDRVSSARVERKCALSSVPSNYRYCADEGSFCSFSGTANVIYGANSCYTSPRSFTDGTMCTNDVFGDPLPGVHKYCYTDAPTPTPTRTPTPTSTPITESFRVFLPLIVNREEGGLVNGDFEDGSVGWIEYSAQGWPLILSSDHLPVSPHSGNWAVWLGGDDDEISHISQETRVPPNQPYLTYWHWIASDETGCNWDYGRVMINGTVVDEYGLCPSMNTYGWSPRSVNLSAYSGQLVSIQIGAETDSSVTSNLFIDDVSFASLPLLASERSNR